MHFTSRRSPVLGTKAAVASSQPLASQIGADILKQGGNAIDASVAMAAALNVTEPCSTGLGGDCFLLYYQASTKEVLALNGSGRSALDLTLEQAKADVGSELEELPMHHPHTVTVPGAAAGWVDAVEQWGTGTLTLRELLEPAIHLAEGGFPVSPLTAQAWEAGMEQLQNSENMLELLQASGKAPRAGEIFKNKELGSVLRELGDGGKDAFYKGRIGQAIVDMVRGKGGRLSMQDLAQHESTFPVPICTQLKGRTIHEVPPNGQGITVLLALNILKHTEILQRERDTNDMDTAQTEKEGEDKKKDNPSASSRAPALEHNSARYLHLVIEALRLAFADTRYFCTDMDVEHVPVKELLSDEYARARAKLIDPSKATADVRRGTPTSSSCTVSFQVVDEWGNAVSFLNSNYHGFGTGFVPKGCGFTLQNRGSNFSLCSGHPNALQPGKRPYHTIIPCMVTWTDSGALCTTLTNMGGFMQPQGHVQLLLNLLEYGMDAQTALDEGRVCIMSGTANGAIGVEDSIGAEVIAQLRGMGHPITELKGGQRIWAGRAQIIQRKRDSGVLWAGSDGRADGCALAWC